MDEGRASSCTHKMEELPQWQSARKHDRIRAMMQDQKELLERETQVLNSSLFLKIRNPAQCFFVQLTHTLLLFSCSQDGNYGKSLSYIHTGLYSYHTSHVQMFSWFVLRSTTRRKRRSMACWSIVFSNCAKWIFSSRFHTCSWRSTQTQVDSHVSQLCRVFT